MTVAEKYITEFNRLNGKKVYKSSLQMLLTKVKAAKLPELKDVEGRLEKAISGMNGKPVILSISSPVKLPDSKPVKVVAPVKAPVSVKKDPVKKEVIKTVSLDAVPPKVKSNSRSLSGVVDASAIGKLNFKKIDLEGKYRSDFLKMYSDTQIMIWGKPGHGKTVYLLYFAQYLAKKGVKTLYIANEELNRSTLTMKINEHQIGHANLKFTKNFEEMKRAGYSITDFDVIIFDSIQSLGFNLDRYKKFVEENPGICYILVAQSTKNGDFRGGQEWEHEVDIAGEIVNRKLVLRKNRLDPNFHEKADKLMIDERIAEKKKTIFINDKLKSLMKDTVKEKEAEKQPITPVQ
jgi:hypothetical protein